MNPLLATFRRLGPAGACDNALRSCEEYRMANLRADALGRRLEARSLGSRPHGSAARTSTRTTGRRRSA